MVRGVVCVGMDRFDWTVVTVVVCMRGCVFVMLAMRFCRRLAVRSGYGRPGSLRKGWLARESVVVREVGQLAFQLSHRERFF